MLWLIWVSIRTAAVSSPRETGVVSLKMSSFPHSSSIFWTASISMVQKGGRSSKRFSAESSENL